jgi:hypothetical protein
VGWKPGANIGAGEQKRKEAGKKEEGQSENVAQV